ncbi:30S ribosomal protein S18 [Streptomyces sp. gb14]|uniref:30S ribosomal protein S18 n=1 Tax=Streptomyces sp. gb14 TaxID=1827753 RepID=UPI000BF1DFC8|nr:30S ribosomal protein S18 [Streptomyces sp. gb14]
MARQQNSRKPLKARPNPLDAAGITYIDYKDTDLLRRFISDRGKIRSRRVTRISAQQQRQMAAAIKNAREMALLPYSGTAAGK